MSEEYTQFRKTNDLDEYFAKNLDKNTRERVVQEIRDFVARGKSQEGEEFD